MRTSGMILDVYDDPRAAIDDGTLHPDNLTDAMKVAESLTVEQRESLPDHLYALVLYEGTDPPLRKFACVDQGNTELSIVSFLKHGHKLDEELQQRIAENLLVASSWYGIPALEPLEKVALGVGTLMTAASLPSVVGGVRNEAKRNLSVVRQGEAAGGVMGGLHAASKLADVSGSIIAPKSVDVSAPLQKRLPPTKTASSMTPVVRSHAPYKPEVKVAAARQTVDGIPLDSYTDVKQASADFEKNYSQFSIVDRRSYALDLVKRASETGMDVGPAALHYGSCKKASDQEWELARLSRVTSLQSEGVEALDKLAAFRHEVPPDVFAQALYGFDRDHGLHYQYGVHVMDPVVSSFSKMAAPEFGTPSEFTDMQQGRLVRESDLRAFSEHNRPDLCRYFGEDFADEFSKNPVKMYQGLPDNRKVFLSNLIATSQPVRGAQA